MYRAFTFRSLFWICAIGLVLSSCSEGGSSIDKIYEDALSKAERPMADRERDENRKPGKVLQFLKVKPGDRVLDLFSSGGYYTEILNSIVGKDGRVISQNTKSYLTYVKDEIEKRYADGRLSNVDIYNVEANDIDLPEGYVDTAILILGFHDIYYTPEDKSWPTINEEKFLSSIYKSIKPGGIMGIVDHVAPVGSGIETGNTTHRISRDIVKSKMKAAGFIFDGESDILKNPEDDGTRGMWEIGIRGKTDRMVMRFRKPD